MAAPRKDYAKLAAERMYRPADGPKKKPKILVYARNKKGKSTFTTSAGVDNIIIADPEYGLDKAKKINPHLYPIEKWEDMHDFYMWVRSDPVCPSCSTKHKFDWVGVDGLTRISNMSLKFVMKLQEERDLDRIPGMVAQRDYGKSGEQMKTMLSNFHSLNKGVVYTCHERQDSPFEGEEDEDADAPASTYVPDIPKGVRAAVNGLVDVIGRLYVVNVENKEGVTVPQRRLWLGPSAVYDTGVRSDFVLPDMIKNPTVPKLVRLMETGKITTTRRDS